MTDPTPCDHQHLDPAPGGALRCPSCAIELARIDNLFAWWRAVGDAARADLTPDRPSVQHITLVAHHRGLHAGGDGTNCYPSQTTLAELCGIEPKAVRKVDTWLIATGLMALVRRRQRGLREFLLTVPATRADRGDGTHLPPVDNPPDGGEPTHLTPAPDGGDGPYLDAEPDPDRGQIGARWVPSHPQPSTENRDPGCHQPPTHERAPDRDDDTTFDQVLQAVVDRKLAEFVAQHHRQPPPTWRVKVTLEKRRTLGPTIAALIAAHRPDTPTSLLALAALGEPAHTLASWTTPAPPDTQHRGAA